MSSLPAPVSSGVKFLLPLALTFAAGVPVFAADVDPKLDRAVRDAIPVCGDVTVQYQPIGIKLPPRFTGATVQVKSALASCEGQYAGVLSPSGGFFLGNPWPIANEEGKTIEEKVKSFTWRNMHETMSVTVDRTRTPEGLYKVTLHQVTENGKLPMEGLVDPEGTVFFFGTFRPTGTDVRTSRAKVFERYVGHSPTKGAADAPVTIVEFSDFQCPSCQRASGYLDPILAKHGDRVRYVRYDLPLTGHSWAFGAALAGRAIYRQKPDAFWEYKKQVYANQENLNPFSFWDFARGFAADHELDLKQYDADLASDEIKAELLSGAGSAFTNDIRATPSYMINGALVEAGEGGKSLAAYVEKLLAK
jgi:protein-disulfide isomerase